MGFLLVLAVLSLAIIRVHLERGVQLGGQDANQNVKTLGLRTKE